MIGALIPFKVVKEIKLEQLVSLVNITLGTYACRYNIFMARLHYWSRIYDELYHNLHNRHAASVILDTMNEYQWSQYLLSRKLVSPEFLNFYKQYSVYTQYVTQKIKKVIEEQDGNISAISQLTNIITELVNILRIELEGLDISCVELGGQPICSDCRCCDRVTRSITFVPVPEYYECRSVLKQMIESVNKINRKIIFIVDYRNICKHMSKYSWDEHGAYKYYEQARSSDKVAAVYFTNCKCVDFGRYEEVVSPYIVNDKNMLQRIKMQWRDTGKVLIPGSSKRSIDLVT